MATSSTRSGTHVKKSAFFYAYPWASPERLGITLLPDQVAIPSAFQAFGPDGHLVDPKQEAKVKALGAALAENLR